MLASDLRALQESYQEIYEENDGISCEMIEEVIEELIEECVEFGYTLDEAARAVEQAAMLYIDEAKVTYGSDTESPEQRRERAKAKVGEKKAAARKAAVKTAVGRVKAKASGAKAMAGIAGSIAKDEARRAGRAAQQAVVGAVQKKKAEVKSGVKGLIGRGLRKAAGAVGKVASKASTAAARLGEEAIQEDSRRKSLRQEELELDQMIESLVQRGHTEKEAYALVAQFTLDEIFGLGGKSAKDRLANSDYMKKKNKEADEKAIQNLKDMMSKDPERQKRPSRINTEGYQRNPEKGEKEDKKYAPVRGERTPMPPRGDKRREDFEKWYAAQRR